MKYMLFCCNEEKKLDAMSASEMDAVMDETHAYIEELRRSENRGVSPSRLSLFIHLSALLVVE